MKKIILIIMTGFCFSLFVACNQCCQVGPQFDVTEELKRGFFQPENEIPPLFN